jgi:hypothetical protein
MAKMWASMQKGSHKDDTDYGYGADGSAGASSQGNSGGSWNNSSDGSWKNQDWKKKNWKNDSWKSYDDGATQEQQADDPHSSVVTQEMRQMKGKMQDSLGELAASLLGKNAALEEGLVHERSENDEWGKGDGSGSGKAKVNAPAPPLNPFRSKPRNAPVAADPDPAILDPPIDFKALARPDPEPSQLQQQEQQLQQQLQQHQEQQRQKEQEQQFDPPLPPPLPPPDQRDAPLPPKPEVVPPPIDPPLAPPIDPPVVPPPPVPPPPEPTPEVEPWTAEKLASLNIPPGIAVRMIRQNKAVLTASFVKEMADAQAAQEAAANSAAESADKDGEGKGEDGDNPDVKRAQAIATLSYYGLTDPTNQEDVAKAVQAVAVATGDQATAVALWHQMCGTEGEAAAGVTTLSEEQQLEVQQAAASAQYSQYWLQQQFQSQLAMFENQRLMATGDNPVTTVEDAKESALKGPRGDPAVRGSRRQTNQPMLPGDWTCPGCGDHQFARNRVCRFCGASRPLGSH